MLTDDESFLDPYFVVRDSIAVQMNALRQRALVSAAREHLETLVPVVEARMAHILRAFELHRSHDVTAALEVVRNGQGKRMMDSIRAEMSSFINIEEVALAQLEVSFQSHMRYLFTVIVVGNLFTLLCALSFAYLIYRETQHRLKNLVYLETQDLLRIQKETNTELEIAKTAAEKANLAKSEFLSSMSHELRSPLNAILGFAQLMESDTPAPTIDQQESIAQILQAGWHLLKLIDEVLDLTKIESRQVPLSHEPVLISEVLLECRGMVETQAQKRDIALVFPKFDLPYYVKADRTRVKQVLINLLSNAIKYNHEHGAVEVSYSLDNPEHMRLNVKDSGAGLSADQMAQLFQPFNRLGQEVGTEEGTGIGLVVAKRLVELMGGVIGVESTVGVGTVFWFELSLTEAPELFDDQDEPAVVPALKIPTGATQHTLLYVEDNPANMKLVERLVARRPDLRLLTAPNGISGVELARTSQPSAILMDINLPDINGFEALKILRDDSLTAHIPIVAISANAVPRDVEKGIHAGFFRYLTKPIKISEFMDTLDAVLEFAEKRDIKDK